MIYKAEDVIEKLYKHANDYAEGKTQDFDEVFNDCKIAADMIKTLKSSKHTKKRRAQRLRKKCKEKNKKIEVLTEELNHIKE